MRESPPPVHFVVPGSIAQRTGGYGYDRRIVEELRRAGRPVRVVELDGEFPLCDDIAEEAAVAALADAPDGTTMAIDGLALPAFSGALPGLAGRVGIVALVHHPLALESGLSVETKAYLARIEGELLPQADRIVTTSAATAAALTDYGLSTGSISVVVPGTEPVPAAVGSDGDTVQLLCVGALIPRKGHRILIDALADCAELRWRLRCYGSLDRDPETVARIEQRIERYGLTGRVVLAGEADETELASAYAAADVFVLASKLEGYGMAFAEALARGLPIVASGEGAVSDTVPQTAGIVLPVGDRAALADALARVVEDAGLRGRLAEGARAAGLRLPDWPAAGKAFAEALDRVAAVAR